MYKHFDAEFFIGNRQRLRTLFTGTAPIILTANGLLQSSSDVAFPFRQDSNFWYLTGVPDPDIILVIDKEKEFLVLPNYSVVQEIFDDPVNLEILKKTSGVSQIYSNDEGWKLIEKRLRKSKHVATIAPPPEYIDHYGFYTNPGRSKLVERLRKSNPDLELLDLQPHLSRLRMIKQKPEIAAIQDAISITTKTIKKIQRRNFKFEYQIEAAITANFREFDGAGHGWPPVIATGERACVIHHMDTKAAIGPKDLILVDIGAEVDGYNADISRTYAQGTPTKRQKQVYEAVLNVQEYAISLLKPGVLIREFEKAIEDYMGEKLRELGLIKTIDHDQVRAFFPHAACHHLGLDPHDAADYDEPLAAGAVMAVEPGIYIPKESIGIRVEDNVLITASGNKVLSASLPRRLY